MTLGNANWHVSPINNVRMDKSVKMDYALKGVLIIRIVLDKMFASKADVSILAPLVKLVVPTVNVRLETKLSIAVVQTDLQVNNNMQYALYNCFVNLTNSNSIWFTQHISLCAKMNQIFQKVYCENIKQYFIK